MTTADLAMPPGRKFQEDLLGLFAEQNKTFTFDTHSVEEAVDVSDQIAVLLPHPSWAHEVLLPQGLRTSASFLMEHFWVVLMALFGLAFSVSRTVAALKRHHFCLAATR